MQNVGQNWFPVPNKGCWKYEKKAKAMHNTPCTIEDKSDTESKTSTSYLRWKKGWFLTLSAEWVLENWS